MKKLNYFGVAFCTLCAFAFFVLFICWGVSLPETALLWINGPASGWAELLTVDTLCTFLVWCPCLILIDEIRNEK